MKNKKRKFIILSIIAFISIFSISWAVGSYFYNLALDPTTDKSIIFANSSSPVQKSWLEDNSEVQDTYINSEDNLKLHGYEALQKENTNKWVISVHGYTNEGLAMGEYAKEFFQRGYNVLVPDLRGHGKSEGDYIGMGWDDRKDILSWINKIIKENPQSQIILHGVSMGAATVMMTTGENLPSNVKLAIEDCGYTSVWDIFSYQLDKLFSLPAFPILDMSNFVTKSKAGYSLKDASAIKQIENAKIPMLFIHGDKDDFVPFTMLNELYEKYPAPKKMLIIEGAEHADAFKVSPEIYWNNIDKFLTEHN